MFETIVVGVDGREGGRDALALAGLLQRSFGSEIIAVHAFPYSYFLGANATARYDVAARQESLDMLARELEAAGMQGTPEARSDDSAARTLHEAAEHYDADLIVVGSDRHGRVGRVLPGDVTASALHGSPCAVAVAPRGYADQEHQIRAIAVGLDGSPEAEMALHTAAQAAAIVDARVEIAFVVAPAAPRTGWSPYAPITVVELQRSTRERAEREVEEALARLGPDATGHTPDGLAHERLAELSERVDLLVVGSRGYGPLRRLLLGSTSGKLVREAACPVIALPRGAVETASPIDDAAVAQSES